MKLNIKSKNLRMLIFSAAGLAVLVIAVLLLTVTAPRSEEDEGADSSTDPVLVLQPEDLGDIVSITVDNELGSFTARLTKQDGESLWTIDGKDIDRDLLNTGEFDRLAAAVTKITARSVVEENPADLAQYGLEQPQAAVTVDYTDGSFFMKIGDTVTTGSANYVMVNDDPVVYSCGSGTADSIIAADWLSMINTAVTPAYDSEGTPEVEKITVTRKDLELPIVLEKLPALPEDSNSVQVYNYTFTSPAKVYLSLDTGDEYLYAMFGLSAEKAAYVSATDEEMAAAGLDDPFCKVDMLAGDTIYRLYIGNAVTKEVTDEKTGKVTTVVTGYYGICSKVPEVVYVFGVSDLIWVTMEPNAYMSKVFLTPYIYDLDTLRYHDNDLDFTVKITGNTDENAMYIDGEEIDADLFRSFHLFITSCRGEELYSDEARGEFIAEVVYDYEDDDGADTVTFYSSEEDRTVIIAVNGINMFKTRWNYGTRLQENAKALISGGEIVQNY